MALTEWLPSVGLEGDDRANRGGIQLGTRCSAKEYRLLEQREMDGEDDRKRIDTRADSTN